MIKRYLCFAGDYYYPDGGWRDFRGSFDTELEAVVEGKRPIPRWEGDQNPDPPSWFDVVDSESAEIVSSGGNE